MTSSKAKRSESALSMRSRRSDGDEKSNEKTKLIKKEFTEVV